MREGYRGSTDPIPPMKTVPATVAIRVMGPTPEDLEVCSRCNRPRGMHLQMTFRNDWYKGHEGYEVWVCAELLPQFEGHPK